MSVCGVPGWAPGWLPSSPCTLDCLPPPPAARHPWRLTAMGGVVAAALCSVLLPGAARGRWLSRCARWLLRAAGVRLVVHGDGYAPPGQGVLVVANHTSWVDVVALLAVAPVRMVAKREVAGWPVIGGIAERAGALFVDRRRLRALPATVDATAAALRAGAAVGVFPEGTTWCGAAAGVFRRAPFQAAIDAAVPVRPVAIALRAGDGTAAPGASFVGDQTLLDTLRRVVAIPDLVCEVTVLPLLPVDVAGDRRTLAARAAIAVAAATGVAHGAAPAVADTLAA